MCTARAEGDASPRRRSVPLSYFDELYEADPDPWRYTSRWYERRKYAITLASLPLERYGSALEVGCSIGAFTRLLAGRCSALLAVDGSARAVELAEERLGDLAHVTVRLGTVPDAVPDGPFDLVVACEILYYLEGAAIEQLLDRLIEVLAVGGDLVVAHWRSRQPLSYDGFNIHAGIRRRKELVSIASHDDEGEDGDGFVLDVLRRCS